MAVLRARGGVMEREFALGVVIQLLAPCIERLGDRDRERAFAGAAGLARPLFEEVPDRAADDDRLFARFHGLHWLCARLAEERPLALLVDDAHWADGQSIRFLAYLEARIDEIPACAIVAVRTGEAASAPDALARLAGPRPAVRPPPLSPAAIAELVRGGLGAAATDAVCAECARTTGGNPLLVRQLITALGERDGELGADAIAAIGPPSVARFVADRLGRRPEATGAVARALAILGDDASLEDAAAVAGVDREAAAGAVDALIEAQLLHPRLPPRFVHPIVHQALLDSIPPAGRAQLHLAAARELARTPARCERTAAHLLAAAPAGLVGEPWAYDALTAAARQVAERGAPDDAVRLLRRALEEAPSRSLLLELGAAEAAGRMPEAAGRMEDALRLSSGPAERANAVLGLSMVRFLAAELPAAVAACEAMLAAGGRARPGAAPRARVPGGRHAHGRRAAQRGDVRADAGARARGEPGRDGGGARPARPDRARLRRDHRAHRAPRSRRSPRRHGATGSSWSRSAPSTRRWRRPRRRSR